MTLASDQRWMSLALSLGARGQGQCWPNPSVGCVIIKEGRVVGRGWTQPGGRPHAEAVALDQAGAQAKGATVYVTLEPCSHTGKTPPCANALINAGVARVVVAMKDPDKRVNGAGIALLEAADISVSTGMLEDKARKAHRGFILNKMENRPFVTLKLASSFDGRIATASGESQWITGPVARREVHAMRARHDAVMVGGGTARADLPSLTVRGLGATHQPVRVIVSAKLNLPDNGPLAEQTDAAPLWLICADTCPTDQMALWKKRGAKILSVAADKDGRVLIAAAMEALGNAGITSVLCEGGGSLAASLLSADKVDCLVGFTAGIALGDGGRASIGELPLKALADAPRFALSSYRSVGDDVMHLWERSRT